MVPQLFHKNPQVDDVVDDVIVNWDEDNLKSHVWVVLTASLLKILSVLTCQRCL